MNISAVTSAIKCMLYMCKSEVGGKLSPVTIYKFGATNLQTRSDKSTNSEHVTSCGAKYKLMSSECAFWGSGMSPMFIFNTVLQPK